MSDSTKTREMASDILKKEGVKWLQVRFTDIVGRLRGVFLPAEKYYDPGEWDRPITFDASSVNMASVSSSDMFLVPDPSSLIVYPWTMNGTRSADVYAWVRNRDGEMASVDSREVARKTDSHIAEMGFSSMKAVAELEFYLFHSPSEAMLENDLWHREVKRGVGTTVLLPELLAEYNMSAYPPRPGSSYFISESKDATVAYRNEFVEKIKKVGVPVKYHHHEVGSRQVEVEISPLPSVVSIGDSISTSKALARMVAPSHGFVASFMPKPLTADAGSGLHIHVEFERSEGDGGKEMSDEPAGCVFFDPETGGLSQTGRYFIGGVLEKAREMALVTNPTVNSYRRLVPGFEAPRYAVWAYANRSSMIRIPPVKNSHLDVEIRSGDPSANPYLLGAVIIEAGMCGIRKKIDCGDPVEENVDNLSRREIRERGIKELPATLGEAIEEAENSDFLRGILGDALDVLLEYKRKEWERNLGYVSPWEIYHYFDV